MPHICKNWLSIEGPAPSLATLASKELHPSQWAQNQTCWVGAPGPVFLKGGSQGALEATFFTKHTAPISFYSSLAALFPECKFTYEYSIDTLNRMGHGITQLSNISVDFSYSSPKELEAIKAGREWHLEGL